MTRTRWQAEYQNLLNRFGELEITLEQCERALATRTEEYEMAKRELSELRDDLDEQEVFRDELEMEYEHSWTGRPLGFLVGGTFSLGVIAGLLIGVMI